MKVLSVFLLIQYLALSGYAQESIPQANPAVIDIAAPEDEIFTIVEQMPEFPGGQSALLKYLSSNIQYPEVCRKMGVEGKVFIKFVVNKDGIINDVAVLRGVPDCNLLEKEAMRVVKSMPKWAPGKQLGKAVNVYFTLPVSFKLDHDSGK